MLIKEGRTLQIGVATDSSPSPRYHPVRERSGLLNYNALEGGLFICVRRAVAATTSATRPPSLGGHNTSGQLALHEGKMATIRRDRDLQLESGFLH